MQITKIEIYHTINSDKVALKATVNIELENCLRLTDMSIYKNPDNVLFVTYPIRNNFQQSFYPTKKELREYIEKTILAEYKERAQ